MRHFALLLGIALSLSATSAIAQNCDGFTDVLASSPFCPDVTFITAHGITKGCAPSQFCPDENVSRLQMAAFMHRLGQEDPSNTLGDNTTTIGGGTNNVSNAVAGYSTVSGGGANSATDLDSTVSGGFFNKAVGPFSVVIGGSSNFASGFSSTVLGGDGNVASGDFSIALGSNAIADQDNCMVISLWSDGGGVGASCVGSANIVSIGVDHGMSIDYGTENLTNGEGSRYLYVGDLSSGNTIAAWNGASLTDGGTWTNASDRALKTDFAPADAKSILDKVSALPMDTWRYKSESDQRHIGPTAQDFYAAFGLGADDKHITTVDEGGVALAAIQGLNAKVDEQTSWLESAVQTIQTQEREIAELRERVQKAETLAADVAALRAALVELQRGRETVAVK
jgi:hypothetical protein